MHLRKMLPCLFLILSLVNESTAQTKNEWKHLLDAFCERHYENCFGQNYLQIYRIDEIIPIEEGKVNVRGVVSHTNFFNIECFAEFKATITLHRDKVNLLFKRQSKSTFTGNYWEECKGAVLRE